MKGMSACCGEPCCNRCVVLKRYILAWIRGCEERHCWSMRKLLLQGMNDFVLHMCSGCQECVNELYSNTPAAQAALRALHQWQMLKEERPLLEHAQAALARNECFSTTHVLPKLFAMNDFM